MRTLNISISDLEGYKFGLPKDQLTFSDFVEIVSNELSIQNMKKCVKLAERYGLSPLTTDDITEEVNAVRKHAK